MSSRKKLRASTIIPDELYVDRAADRQLDMVIDEMGRPGYVLVARQMGKTNLLLRMKRQREEVGDLALYFDLSTPFETARELFRTVIDALLEYISDDSVTAQVLKDRKAELDANAEYDRHLRLILRIVPNPRVILIFDEIDSLVGHAFSDRILSQIRSMYFARANHSVYEKLTYVLSGVAEPTDLIKDKNVSPFNIGEKIYLSDFTLSEAKNFVDRAGLAFPLEVVESIYAWAGGNPRMTWDICAALEDCQISGEELSAATVDAVIQRLYLTRFDRAPLDHIRALAESDQQVRDALVTLLYGKGATLDDRARSKLYLAGITTASANEAPKIKNRVIEQAISESWLAQVEAGKRGLVQAASRRYQEQAYLESIDLYHQFIQDSGGIDSLTEIDLMNLGLSYYRVSRLEEADETLSASLKQTRSPELRNLLRFHIATARLLSGNATEALPLLEKVAADSGAYRIQAKHQIASALAATSPVQNASRIIAISREVLDALPHSEDLTEDDARELRAAAYYTLSQAYRAQGKLENAKKALKSALAPSLASELPGVSFLLLEDGLDLSEWEDTFEAAASAVIEKRPQYSLNPASFTFNKLDMAALLYTALSLNKERQFARLLNVASEYENTGALATIYELASQSTKPGTTAKLSTLVEHALSDQNTSAQASLGEKTSAARYLLLTAKEDDRSDSFDRYFRILQEHRDSANLSDDDLVLLINNLTEAIHAGQFERADTIIKISRKHEEHFVSLSGLLFAIVVFHEMNLALARTQALAATARAKEVLTLLDTNNLQADPLASHLSSTVSHIRGQALATLSKNRPPAPKLGRNQLVRVRYLATGRLEVSKFKKLADKLAAEEVEIVEVLDREGRS